MKKNLTLIAFLLYCCTCFSQQYDYNQVWAFGDSAGINFNTSPPSAITTSIPGYEGVASVSDQAGQLLFYTEGRSVWSRNHVLMPNGTGLMPNALAATTTQQAAIINIPGSASQYYIFSLNDNNGQFLYYSRVDMNLNGGFGDVIAGQKAIMIDSSLTEKMTVVPGNNCDTWLLVRSRAGVYKAYHITASGFNTTPVLSAVGNSPNNAYSYGYLVASRNRLKIAAGVWYGAELCDFDPNTGLVSNPVHLPSGPSNTDYYGLCFSPDDSKLYGISIGVGVNQFDLSQPTTAAIIASLTNITTDFARGIRLASDGKIYFPQEVTTTMRSIEAPNLAGAACQYNSNALQLVPGTLNMIGLPNYNAIVYRDSVRTRYVRHLCDGSVQLSPFNSGIDYLWENGTTNPQRTVTLPGTYVLRYHLICSFFSDTFRVLPEPVFPVISQVTPSCTGQQTGKIVLGQQNGDTTTYRYTWYDNGGNILQQNISANGSQLYPATNGNYQVHISTADGCDTMISITVPGIAAPVANFDAGPKFCAGEPIRFGNTTGGPADQFYWDFGDQGHSTVIHPEHTYAVPGDYTVMLIAANSSCSDTLFRDLSIYSFDLSLTVDKPVVDFKESFTLQTSAPESYSIISWMPQSLFPDQQALAQTRQGDTTLTYIVTGQSLAHQCTDTASLLVLVNPFINFPSAFSPNGDGLNDYFSPVVWGSDPGIKRFAVYDRWGKKVWSATGQQALKGWDGSYPGGAKADLGTYYWYLELTVPFRGQHKFKGDVTLMK